MRANAQTRARTHSRVSLPISNVTSNGISTLEYVAPDY